MFWDDPKEQQKPAPAPATGTPSPSPAASAPMSDDLAYLWEQFDARTKGSGSAEDPFEAEAGAALVFRNGSILNTENNGKKEPLLKISDAMWRFYRMSDKQVAALAQKLFKAGKLANPDAERAQVWDAFLGVLQEAALMYSANPDKAPTVDQLLQGYMKNPVGSAGEKKPESYTQTTTSLTDPSTASELLTKTLTDQLGRAPTEAEKHGFLGALNAAQRANPQKTTYTLNKETGGYDTSVSSEGINPTGFADDYVQDDPALAKERGAFQMASTYFGALESALGAIGGA